MLKTNTFSMQKRWFSFSFDNIRKLINLYFSCRLQCISSILKINGFLYLITRNDVAEMTFHLKNITSNTKQNHIVLKIRNWFLILLEFSTFLFLCTFYESECETKPQLDCLSFLSIGLLISWNTYTYKWSILSMWIFNSQIDHTRTYLFDAVYIAH